MDASSPGSDDRLAAEALRDDERLAAIREQLLSLMAEYQSKIDGIRPADPQRAEAYRQRLEKFGGRRGGSLFYPYLGSGLGHGPYVELADGSVKLDLIGGIGVHGLGHGHPAMVSAALDAATEDLLMQGNLQQNELAVCVSEQLLERVGDADLKHVFLTTSGAMANENALKLAFHHRPGTTRVLAMEHNFCGRTLALSTVTDKPANRVGLPAALEVDYLPFYDADDPTGSTEAALARLEDHLAAHPEAHAALMIEMVQGEGGYYPGDKSYFRPLLERAREAGIAVIVDEVQTFGRLTKPFAFDHFGVGDLVDIVTVGKITQFCATLFTEAMTPEPGLISQTFTASTSALRGGSAVLQTLVEAGAFGPDGRNETVGAAWRQRLADLAAARPGMISGPYGIGSMVALTPGDGSKATAKRLAALLFEEGVISFIAGADPARLRFLLPTAVLEEAHLDEAAAALARALDRLEKETS
ncbi:MAG: aminotransferase class III-fold pyridoxal phosphate-dependent enzyme [Phycisphaeraceae bacterium]|nr:aminotransferase class III-fold pyridoxal phosphate-dependent enzyme [Phycisphaeraceae bacterium]